MPNEPLTRLPAESQSGHLRLESRREGHSPPPVPPPDVPLADESVPREDPDRPKLSRQKHAGLHGRLHATSCAVQRLHHTENARALSVRELCGGGGKEGLNGSLGNRTKDAHAKAVLTAIHAARMAIGMVRRLGIEPRTY